MAKPTGEDRERNEGKSKKRKKERSPSPPTLTIALPGSIIRNAQSLELATLLAGQIARAAAIFRIDEVVVFDDKETLSKDSGSTLPNGDDEYSSGAPFLIKILQYLETPQYLRRILFPKHGSLKYVGLLPPLDASHHVRKHEWSEFREGITMKAKSSISAGTLVDVGLSKEVMVEQVLEPGLRVTVSMGNDRRLESDCLLNVVSSSKPRELGHYWGYRVRYACNISSAFNECPYEGGYDHRIGTSEHGTIIDSSDLTIPSFRHLLIAFGGLGGLEENVEEDTNCKGTDVRDFFDAYLNICPHQGSRTIRTEEAIFISLQYFQEPVKRAIQRHRS
ncbi:hypothetical protein AMTRI_Chr01g135780 [Amborella trichopoda]